MVLGGLGNVLGTVIASYFLGLAETFTITFFGYFLPRDSIAFILMILVLIFLPSGVMGRRQRANDPPYYMTVMTFMSINILLALSVGVLTGYAGQVSLGQAAFMGIGAYTAALVTTKLGLSCWLGIPCSYS